jgi:ribosomal protein L6P/L9E
MKIQKNNIIKVPNDISLIYCDKKKIIIFSGPIAKKILKVKLKLIISNSQKVIKVSLIPFANISNIEKKKLRSLQGTTVAILQQLVIETSTLFCQKLKLVGVGYRSIPLETFENKLMILKLGFSHFLYFRISKKINFFCKKQTQLFFLGNSYQEITQIVNNIRAIKPPEPYKGKGILYANEIIHLKKGKKI